MIIFNDVTKQFGDDTYALEAVSFVVEPGEFVFLTGPSGSGKTTVMRLLTREYTPSSGEIIFGDQPLQDLKSQQVYQHRRQIGVIFQDYKLLPESNVWENIALPLFIIGKSQSEIESRVTDLLKLVNLTDKAYLFPSQLSGGEAQRVSIARALATGPQVIFADEPTGNLDPETSVSIAKLLHKINQLGTTVLLATHDTGVLAALKGERQLQLKKGRLVHDTKPHSRSESSTVTKSKPVPPVEPAATPDETEPTKPAKDDDKVTAPKPTKKTGKKWGLPSLKWGKRSAKAASASKSETDSTADTDNDADDQEPTPEVKVEELDEA